MNNEIIEVPKDVYESMLEIVRFMSFLQAAGVDNWEGYDIAREMMEEEENG